MLLGGSIGPVPAYNSNGLWLRSPAEVAREAVELREEGGFEGLKLRLGRERLSDDLATIAAVREAVGTEMSLMVDFNPVLHLGEALERCYAIDDLGLAWIEEPIVYDNLQGYARLTADLKTPVQIGENFYGPRALYSALQMKACDYVMPDFMRIGGVTGWQRAAASPRRQAFPSIPISIPRSPLTSDRHVAPRDHSHRYDLASYTLGGSLLRQQANTTSRGHSVGCYLNNAMAERTEKVAGRAAALRLAEIEGAALICGRGGPLPQENRRRS